MRQLQDRTNLRRGPLPWPCVVLVAATLVAAAPGTVLAEPPEFLRPGARLSWAAGDSVLEGSRFVLDPAGTILSQKRGRIAYRHRRLVSARTVAIPWATAPLPSWFRPGLVTDYQGVSRAEMDQPPGLSPLPGTAIRVSFAFERAAAGGVLGRQVVTSALGPGLPDDRRTSPRAFGPAMFDGLWIPPPALATLSPGQRLDADPLTGQVVTFAGAEDGRAILVSEGPADRLELFYDLRSGLLVFSRATRAAGPVGRQVIELGFAGQR